MTAPESAELQIRELKQRIGQAQQRQARATVERENAAAALERAKAALAAEFEVRTPEEAKAKLDALDADLACELATVRAALSDA